MTRSTETHPCSKLCVALRPFASLALMFAVGLCAFCANAFWRETVARAQRCSTVVSVNADPSLTGALQWACQRLNAATFTWSDAKGIAAVTAWIRSQTTDAKTPQDKAMYELAYRTQELLVSLMTAGDSFDESLTPLRGDVEADMLRWRAAVDRFAELAGYGRAERGSGDDSAGDGEGMTDGR